MAQAERAAETIGALLGLWILRGAEGWTIKIIAYETVYGVKSNVYER